MQTLVFVLMLLVCFNFLLKQTYNKRWAVGITTLACALWTGLSWPYAILQSKTQIADWLANPALMLDTSVILSVEICMQLAFCLLAVHLMTGGTVPRRTLWIYRFLRWFPGFLIFPVLFSELVALIFSFPGTSASRELHFPCWPGAWQAAYCWVYRYVQFFCAGFFRKRKSAWNCSF